MSSSHTERTCCRGKAVTVGFGPADSFTTDRQTDHVTTEMARPETTESVAETGVGGHGPSPSPPLLAQPHLAQPSPYYCHHHWLWDWYRSGTGNHPPLQPLQALYLSYPLPYPHPEGQDEPQTHQRLPALLPSPPPSPLCNRREERGSGRTAPSALLGEQSDSETEELQEASRQQGPLPDLLHQIEPPSWPSPHQRVPRREGLQELEVRRLASQLRAIGDEFNTTVLRRAHAAPQWQDWRDACRGLFNFITQTLSTLYRLT
ncbi:hypothetical protein Q5P01_009590 [Channa striata]|uniref:BCL2 binding component 3 n=1 Tax=Channa striata TaxID=64152 RepID=A0AA88MZ44_CHASR|nr:hypothetical protein Q5P01_009590 [Channa striata]